MARFRDKIEDLTPSYLPLRTQSLGPAALRMHLMWALVHTANVFNAKPAAVIQCRQALSVVSGPIITPPSFSILDMPVMAQPKHILATLMNSSI